jgi:hypothetical protein
MVGNYMKKVILDEKNGQIAKDRPFEKKKEKEKKRKEKLFHCFLKVLC